MPYFRGLPLALLLTAKAFCNSWPVYVIRALNGDDKRICAIGEEKM